MKFRTILHQTQGVRQGIFASFVCMVILALVSVNLFSGTMESKLNLEQSIQERAERLAERIIGSKDMVVLVNVELEEEGAKKKTTAEDKAYRGLGMTEEEYLPGITYSYIPSSEKNKTDQQAGFAIKKITVLIIIDVEVSNAVVSRLKKEVNEILGLNPIRGDVVNVQKIVFAKKILTWVDYLGGWKLHIYWFLTLLVLTLFLFGTLRGFFKMIVKALQVNIEGDMRLRSSDEMGTVASRPLGTIPSDAGVGGALYHHASPGTKESPEGPVRRFGFVNEDNLKNLIYLLKKEKSERIAIIISYLPSVYSSQILSSLPPNTQSEVAMNLSQVKQLTPSEVEKIEEEMKDKIDYLLGGEDYFLGILDKVDRETQENLLETIEKQNQTLSEKLRRSLFFFEDLAILEKSAIQRVVRESQRRNISFAVALKKAADETKNAVMNALTEGAQAMLAEQIDLLGDLQEKRITEEQRHISNLVRELEKAGEIIIDRTKKYGK